jgi:excisionase family DNA binding protein
MRKGKTTDEAKTKSTGWPETGLATYEDAAKFLKVSTRTVKRYVKAGVLNAARQSRQVVRLSWSQLRAFEPKASN